MNKHSGPGVQARGGRAGGALAGRSLLQACGIADPRPEMYQPASNKLREHVGPGVGGVIQGEVEEQKTGAGFPFFSPAPTADPPEEGRVCMGSLSTVGRRNIRSQG